jgi:hypothetical protein
MILLAGPDQGNGESFCRHLEVKRTWKDQSWIKSPNLVEPGILNGPCSSADLPGFQVKIQSKFGDFPAPLHFVIF